MQFPNNKANNNINVNGSILSIMLIAVASYFSSSRTAVASAAAAVKLASASLRRSRVAAAGHRNSSHSGRCRYHHHHHHDHASYVTSLSVAPASVRNHCAIKMALSSSSSSLGSFPSSSTRLFHHDSRSSISITNTDEDQIGCIPTITPTSMDNSRREKNDYGSVEEEYYRDSVDEIREKTSDDNDDDATSSSQTWQNPRSRWAKRKHRKKMEKLLREGNTGDGEGGIANVVDDDREVLDWESFEFGTSPKMDKRFVHNDSHANPANQTGIPNHVLNTIATNTITYQTYLQHEANVDKSISTESIRSKSELLSLSPQMVEKSIAILSPYILPRRMERIESILSQRTRHARFLFENPSNPSNVWACLRTLDSFGIQYVDVIVNSDSYQGKAAVNQKRGMRTAMGSAVWMTIRQFGSIEEAIATLRKEEGCLIYASDLNPNAKDVRDLIWDVNFDPEDLNVDNSVEDERTVTDDRRRDGTVGKIRTKRNQRPICIVMGNEERGISNQMRNLADETFYLPMCGFAESFNLSVATAVTLAYMSAASGRGNDGKKGIDGGIKGPLRPGDLDPHELQCLKLRGMINSLAQKRMGKALLKQEGIVLPNSLYKDV